MNSERIWERRNEWINNYQYDHTNGVLLQIKPHLVVSQNKPNIIIYDTEGMPLTNATAPNRIAYMVHYKKPLPERLYQVPLNQRKPGVSVDNYSETEQAGSRRRALKPKKPMVSRAHGKDYGFNTPITKHEASVDPDIIAKVTMNIFRNNAAITAACTADPAAKEELVALLTLMRQQLDQ